jgi:glycosyltransferase involved in cell wall biosynthesis
MVPLKATYSRLTVARFRLRQTIVMWSNTTLRTPIGASLVIAGLVLWSIGAKRRGLQLLLKGRRVTDIRGAESLIRRILDETRNNATPLASLVTIPRDRAATDYASRTLVLKLPTVSEGRIIEKGAIIVKFTETFAPIYQLVDIPLLSKYFRIILEPSWVGYSLPEILIWANRGADKVVVLSPYQDDFDLLSRLDTNLVPVPLGASDWVNPTIFNRCDSEKIYDSIYVANFNPMKRVDRYLRAVVRVSKERSNYRAALVCAGVGPSRHEVLETIKWAASKADIDYLGGVNHSRLNELFNKSKVNVLLSLREGANKVLTEGMFAGTPGLLIAENMGVNRVNINNETGRIVPDAELEKALIWFSDNYHHYQPRRWAETHISPIASTHVLSQRLKEIEITEGRIWTKDPTPKVNQPELGYLNPADNWLLEKRVPLLQTFSRGADVTAALQFIEERNRYQARRSTQ